MDVKDAVRTRMPRIASLLFWSMLAAVSLLTLSEIDQLIGQAIGQDHQSHPLSAVIGPLALTNISTWAEWASSPDAATVGWWIIASVVVDAFFILAYAAILFRLVKRAVGVHGEPLTGRRDVGRVFLLILLGVEAAEGLALLGGAITLIANGDGGAKRIHDVLVVSGTTVEAASTAKWLVAVLLAVTVLRNPGTRRVLARVAQRTAQAVWVHRLSAVLVLALGVMACIPTGGVLDQLPDVQRQWLDSVDSSWHYLTTAGLTLLVAAAGAFLLGRQRARCSYEMRVLPEEEVHRLRARKQWPWWLLPVAVWLFVGGLTTVITLGSVGRDAVGSHFSWSAFYFLGIPLLVLALSWLIGKLNPADATHAPDSERAVYAWIMGDVLAVLILCVGGLGLVRSFTAPVFLSTSWAAVAMFAIGVIAALGWPLLMPMLTAEPVTLPAGAGLWTRAQLWPSRALVRAGQATDPTAARDAEKAHKNRLVLLGILLAGVAILLTALFFPVWVATVLGGAGVTVLLITAWGMVLGAFTVALQDFRALPLFRWMHLKAAPVLTLAIVLPLGFAVVSSATFGGDPTEHAVRLDDAGGVDAATAASGTGTTADTATAATTDPTASIVTALSDRIAQSDCYMTSAGGTVKPIVIVAAEGGGIRAAYFTASALSKLWSEGGCLPDAVLLSSGVSGGSLGLAMVKTSGVDATKDLTKVAGPAIVATGVTGLLDGDIVAAATGIHAPSLVDGTFAWRDRASLIEKGWMDASPKLAEPFDLTPSPGTGYALLNSTDARSGCRVVVGQLPVGAPAQNGPDTKTPITCSNPGSAPAETANLATIYGQDCPLALDWAGAAMLSARFPIITPAGRFPSDKPCANGKTTQLVDGGYAEGSGLGTVADLAPTIAAAFRAYNASHTIQATPILLFLRNSSGFDVQAKEQTVLAEPLVPLIGMGASKLQDDHRALIQRITASFSAVCPPQDATKCEAAQNLGAALPSRTVVVAPFTRPTIPAPLGWALSDYSTSSLENSLERAECADDGSGYSQLCELVGMGVWRGE